jgi:hypothetical protein
MAGKHVGSAAYVADLSHSNPSPYRKENRAWAEGRNANSTDYNSLQGAYGPDMEAWIRGASARASEEATAAPLFDQGVSLPIPDPDFSKGPQGDPSQGWVLGGGASINNGVLTLGAGGTATTTLTLEDDKIYAFTCVAAGGGSWQIDFGGSVSTSYGASTFFTSQRILYMKAPVTGATTDFVLTGFGGTPAITGPVAVFDVNDAPGPVPMLIDRNISKGVTPQGSGSTWEEQGRAGSPGEPAASEGFLRFYTGNDRVGLKDVQLTSPPGAINCYGASWVLAWTSTTITDGVWQIGWLSGVDNTMTTDNSFQAEDNTSNRPCDFLREGTTNGEIIATGPFTVTRGTSPE